MKIKLYDSLMWMLIIIAAGIPLIFGGVLDTWRTILTVLTIVVTVAYLLKHRLRRSDKNLFLVLYLVATTVIIIIGISRGIAEFQYTVYETFYALRQYIWILATIPMYYILVRSQNIDGMMEKLSNIVLLSLVFRTSTWFIKNYLGITVFPNLLYEYGNTWGRNGNQRIDATAFIGILIPLLFYLYEKNKKRKYLYELIFVFLYLILVSQTRMMIAGYIVCICAMIFFKKRKTQKRLFVQLGFIVILVIAFELGIFDSLLDKMNISLNDGSIGYRQYELMYYSSLLIDDKWKTGLGIISTINQSGRRLIYGNLDTAMYLDDLGAFECFLQFGLFSIILYGALLIYMLFVLNKCNKARKHEFSFYILGQFIYIVVTSVSLDLFGIQRVFSVPVILAIICTISTLVGRN